ncbi:DegT/DnrJ/EryC1/StrS family aminotransferase [Saccharopolyspora hirsuta]|uniref:DegT/DnrJ/EryC1/StrS family aminotransferase n=1 Tax=Saccharopolyspora hirsuta TaxID=1837 RepID=UPI001478889C|nr:DegT/DnrJ/EryC1/StrS family aminotransferase [Saccharopolyspora hirsuta]
MRVPFAGVAGENESLLADFLSPLSAQLRSGQFIGGGEVAAFEGRIAELHDVAHAVAVNSGTDALRLVLRALGIEAGATGITVANTFVATAGAMISEGLRPLLVDVADDENIDVEALDRAITADTRVVIAVHLRGLPARIGAIRDLCARRGVLLVEDCAQAILASSDGVPVGGFGIAGCFSLHPLKNLGACGDAGVVVTDDDELARELRLLRNHGLQDRDTVVRWGENSRLDSLQACLLNIKLSHLEEWTKRRRDLAQIYDEGLSGLPITTPVVGGNAVHVYHRYVIRTDQRAELQAHLRNSGIETAIHYPVPIHRQPAAGDGSVEVAAGGLPVTEKQAAEILSLPLHPALDERQIHLVVQEMNAFFGN